MALSDSARTRILPTERLTPRRQLEVIDAIAELGGPDRAPVRATTVGKRLNIAPRSVSGTAGFLAQAGIFRSDPGSLALTELGLTLAQLRSTDSARARLLLRDSWQGQWFQRSAVQHLSSGPLEEAELARRLKAGAPGPAERGLYLTEWLVYALLVHRDELGRCTIPAGEEPPTASAPKEQESLGVLDPLMSATPAEISALPDAQFIALMGAYQTVFASLSPPIRQQTKG
ncbi:hypothetical protein [Streptomyces canus]|uniref:hypothetical protein n=1 Tax=Streptomyces canus TaxID=58343 RepID=UPI002784082A|nr:hypothetical protein [Streptomyces canus]MDQ0761501.1 hypothetical protein [Streptomyces canus]